jgi:Cu2+-exporting ATPase
MEIAIRHFIPGRVRLHVPSLCRMRPLAEAALAWLRLQVGITSARMNFNCAALIIEYNEGHEPQLRALIGRLALMSTQELRVLVISADASMRVDTPQARGVVKSEYARPQGMPLLLPTLSVALAFSLNPIVRAINLPLMLWNAYPIALRAWRVWRREGRLNVDFLDTLAVTASLLQGNPMAGAIVTWLIKLGDWIRDLTAAGSRRAIRELLEFQVKTAYVVRDGVIVPIATAELAIGDEVVVYPGGMIPVDGEIINGRALIDQKTITGEGLPVTRGVGESAFAATVIRDGQITVRAVRVGGDTTAGQIVRLVESAPIGDTRMQNHAERLADRLVVPQLALATGTAVLSADINRFLSLVIVDYGTGIRVAAPTTVLASMTLAARSGIVIKSGRHLERLAEVDTVVFDKTGTLTHGTPVFLDALTYQAHVTGNHLLGLAAAAETNLQHPVAEAMRTRARQLAVNVPHCDKSEYHLGLGVEGQVNGYYVHVGNDRFMQQNNIRVQKSDADRAGLYERGFSCLYIAVDGTLAGMVPYADKIRPEGASILRRLRDLGVKDTIMLTGDNAVVARAVSQRLGLTRHFADMLPTDKQAVIRDLQGAGSVVAMVGDGINDSPALSYADVGIAMKHGAEVAHESAHVVLMEDSLWKLVKAVEISKGAVGLIKQNYAIVAGMNTLALALALPGSLISPTMTALISNGSAILAILNGLRPLVWQR